MKTLRLAVALPWLITLMSCVSSAPETWRRMPEVLAAASDHDWRPVARQNLLYFDVAGATVVIALAPQFAPRHVANLRKLVAAGHFAPARVVRSQDNYVAQWSGRGPTGDAALRLQPEFFRRANGLQFVALDSRDAYATQVGFVDGFPVGRDGPTGRAWLTHCYGMVGVGRGDDADSGNGSELYVVTGHAPRHLDRNVTLIGRVIDGIEHLSSLPRGHGELGLYANDAERIAIEHFRLAAEQDPGWQLLRTDSETFAALVRARRHRMESWFLDPAGAIDLCNVPLPARQRPAGQ